MDISDLTNLFGRSHEQQLLQSVFVRVLQNKGSCDDEQDEKDGEVKNEKYKPEGYSSSLPPLPRPQQQSQSQPSIVRTGTSASKDDLISSSSSDNDEKGTSNSRKNGTTFDRRKKRRRDAGLMPVREVVLVHGKAGTGKTALIHDFKDAVTSTNAGYFCTGTFHQYQAAGERYSGIVEAFGDLWNAIDGRGGRQGPYENQLKTTIKEQLGDDLKKLARICPKLKKLLGPKIPSAFMSTTPSTAGGSVSRTAPKRSISSVTNGTSTAVTGVTSRRRDRDDKNNVTEDDDDGAAPPPLLMPSVSASSFSNPSCFQQLSTVFQRLLQLVCDPKRPVVLFLDDLQWADSASLQFISTLLNNINSGNFMFIGSYRDDVAATSSAVLPASIIPPPLTATITNSTAATTSSAGSENEDDSDENDSSSNLKASASQISVTDIELKNLELGPVDEILSDLTGQNGEAVTELAKIVLAKTHGNPLSIIQFLEMLQRKELLSFSFHTHRWVWDIQLIKSKTDVTLNVGHSLAKRIERMMPEGKKILSLAACIGFCFDGRILEQLAIHLELLEDEMHEHKTSIVKGALQEAISGGLIHPDQIHQMQAVMASQLNGTDDDQTDVSMRNAFYEEAVQTVLQEAEVDGLVSRSQSDSKYRFSHELVHESLYAMNKEGKDRELLHLRIGLVMRAFYETREDDQTLFAATDHLNRGSDHLESDMHRMELVSLNLLASRKAKENSELFSAADFITKGIDLLQVDRDWDNNYDLLLDIYSTAAELECACGRFDLCLTRCQEIQRHARSANDTFRSLFVRIGVLHSWGKFGEAIQVCRKVLDDHLLYESLSPRKTIGKRLVAKERRKVLVLLKAMSDAQFMSLPIPRGVQLLEQMRFLNLLAVVAYHAMDDCLFALVILRMMRLTVEQGLCDFTPFALAGYGVLCAIAGDSREGFRYGRLALRLCEHLDSQLENTVSLPGTYFMVFTMLDHLRNPLRKGVEEISNAYQIGIANGDMEHASLCVVGSASIGLACALPLKTYVEDLKHAYEQLKLIKQNTIRYQVLPFLQCGLNLSSSGSSDQHDVTDHAMDDDEALRRKLGDGRNRIAMINHFWVRYWMAYLMKDYDLAHRMRKELRKTDNPMLTKSHFLFHFEVLLSGLLSFARYRTKKRRKDRVEGNQRIRQLERYMKQDMVNCRGMLSFLQAEGKSFTGRTDQVKKFYDEAIKAFSSLGFIHLQALANERAAEFMLERDLAGSSSTYIRNASRLYSEWGATRKVEQLLEQHSTLKRVKDAPPITTIGGGRSTRTPKFVPTENQIEEEHFSSADLGSLPH